MEKIRKSSVLKMICYILIPILVALLGLSIFHMAFLEEYGMEKEQNDYTQTENFADNYLYFFTNKINQCKRVANGLEQSFVVLQDSEGKDYYFSDDETMYYNQYNGISQYVDYIIIDRETRRNVY